VLNLDDALGIAARAPTSSRPRPQLIGYTLARRTPKRRRGSARAEDIAATPRGSALAVAAGRDRLSAPVVGRFNAANLLAVIAALLSRGEALDAIAAALRRLRPPPGRMQALGGHGQPLVVVDYAHTPDALEKALTVLRETATVRGGRLVCVFGCGGDRDPGKRPQMGAVAEALADRVLVTSDNPRGEDPWAIIEAIVRGMKNRPPVQVERTRAVAARSRQQMPATWCCSPARGTRPYQEIAGVRHAYSDRSDAAAVAALEARR
jgi:UDP-N-acetylmuramyl tripeptide synthase